jgi:hypothetical protein
MKLKPSKKLKSAFELGNLVITTGGLGLQKTIKPKKLLQNFLMIL